MMHHPGSFALVLCLEILTLLVAIWILSLSLVIVNHRSGENSEENKSNVDGQFPKVASKKSRVLNSAGGLPTVWSEGQQITL